MACNREDEVNFVCEEGRYGLEMDKADVTDCDVGRAIGGEG